MLISVIIPVYNAEKHITKCLESVVRAKKENVIEILLIDDGSTDSSLFLCEQFAQKHSFITVFSQMNSGPSFARNKGIEIAKGEFFVFVDADDYVDQDYLEELYNSILNNNSDLACCGYFDHSEYGTIRATNYSDDILYNVNEFIPLVLDKVGGVLWDKIFRKEIIVKNRVTFNTTVELSEDLLFVLEYLKYSNKISIVKKHLYHYNRVDQNGLSKKVTLQQFYKILEVNRIILNSVSWLDIDVKLVSYYLNKRVSAFLIHFCNRITQSNNIFSKKKLMLKELRLHEGYNLNFGVQSVRWVDYPIVLLLNIKKYGSVIYYCGFLNKIK